MAKKNKTNLNRSESLITLDLHGYVIADVIDAVDRFMVKNGSRPRVRIMTGKGKGKVQKEVISYLKQGGFPWSYEKGPSGKSNEGVLIVFLD